MTAGIRAGTTDAALQYNGVDVATFDANGLASTGLSYTPSGTGAVATTVQAKLRESVSVKDFGASTANTAAQNATAFLLAEADGASDIYVPEGVFSVTGSTVLTKRYFGPGTLSYSGIGTVSQTGSGLNDISITGTYTGNSPLQMVVRILTTGAQDTYEWSFNGGVTWETTYLLYNPVDDSITPTPMGCGVYTLPIMGVSISFAAVTGHTLSDQWAFSLRENPNKLNVNGSLLTLDGEPFAGVSGVRNTQLGLLTFGNLNNTGTENTAIGWNALNTNTTGAGAVAVGSQALESNTSGRYNTAFGTRALRLNTTGSLNSATGVYSLSALTTGDANAGYGSDSLLYTTTGSRNTALGIQTLYQNTTGIENTAVGIYASRGGPDSLNTNPLSSNFNTSLGAYSCFQGAATLNVGVGHSALYNNLGGYNTAIGARSGFTLTTGASNVFIGYQAGENGGQAVAATNTVVVGATSHSGANNATVLGANSSAGVNSVAIGYGVSAGSNQIILGNSSNSETKFSGGILVAGADNTQDLGWSGVRWRTVYAGTGAINTSDVRLKQQIRTLSDAERAVAVRCKSLIRAFKFNDAVELKGDGARWHFGVIAQDVKAAFEAEGLVAEDYALLCYDKWEGREDVPDGDRYGIRYEELLAFIVGAM